MKYDNLQIQSGLEVHAMHEWVAAFDQLNNNQIPLFQDLHELRWLQSIEELEKKGMEEAER